MTNSNSKSTPRPWKVAENDPRHNRVEIISCEDELPVMIAEINTLPRHVYRKPENPAADAAFIVRAANAHDALLAALRDIQGVGHVRVNPANAQQWKAALERANDKLEQAMEWASVALGLTEGLTTAVRCARCDEQATIGGEINEKTLEDEGWYLGPTETLCPAHSESEVA